MDNESTPLSEEERRELDELRAEKAAREKELEAQRQRRELEYLKAERKRAEADAAKDARDRALREKNAKVMEPDDDLKMPLGQKIVLVVLFVVVAILIVSMVFGS